MGRKWNLAVCSVLCMTLFSSCVLMPEAEEFIPPPIIPRVEIPLTTETVSRGDIIDYVRAAGRAASVNQHNIYLGFDISSAVLVERSFDPENLRVEAGDILAVFASDDMEAQMAPLQRALELAQINYNAAMRTLEESRAYYEQLRVRTELLRESRRQTAERDLYRLRVRADDARRRYETDRALFELGIVSREALSALERTLRDLESELEALEFQISGNLLLQDAQFEQDLREARARAANDAALLRERINLRLAQDNIRELQERTERFILRAPVDGVITYFEELFIGDTYRNNQRLFTIADDASLFVTLLLDPARRFHFAPGSEVELTASALVDGERQSTRFEGVVISISTDQRRDALLDDDTIVIEVTDWPAGVELGDLVWVYLIRARVYDVVSIPLSALNTIGNFNFVRVMEDDISRERPVEVGIRSTTMAEITHGLTLGEEIVVR